MGSNELSTLEAIRHCCVALEDKKAEDILVLDMRGKSTITDYFVLASGNSPAQLKAMSRAVEATFKTDHVDLMGVDFEPSSGWLVVDGFDFMVHLFLPEQRKFYDLETLWKDADPVDWQNV